MKTILITVLSQYQEASVTKVTYILIIILISQIVFSQMNLLINKIIMISLAYQI